MKAATSPPLAILKSSAEFYADEAGHRAKFKELAAEYDRLKAGEVAALRAGEDALLKHRQTMIRIEAARDVAEQKALDAKANGDEALEGEKQSKLIENYHAAAAGLKAAESDDKEWNALCGAVLSFLEQRKARHDAAQAVNANLPKGFAPLPHIDAPRWIDAEPDREEEVEVDKVIESRGDVRLSVGDIPPTKKVKEKRIVKGCRAIRLTPLWETLQAAGFYYSDADFVVPGMSFRGMRSEFWGAFV
jgi:hypothetical protein